MAETFLLALPPHPAAVGNTGCAGSSAQSTTKRLLTSAAFCESVNSHTFLSPTETMPYPPY